MRVKCQRNGMAKKIMNWNNTDYPYGENGCLMPVGGIVTILAILLFVLASCRTKTVVEYRDRNVVQYVVQEVHDTLFEKISDSVFVEKERRGDTIYITKNKVVEKWKERVVERVDTCTKDSIVFQYKETQKEVFKTPKWCYYCLALCFLFIIYFVIKLARWKH